ncbi:M13 family metallopeptidase [Mycoplasma sp. 21DD0573]|uniref:M13 family metallopeptidase n=1 Tax=unclassified Mycoplasma TaxID=2683645 RepID=UPI002B1D5796|nr:M13 family metallopeptidase [Mycoplasma sp. 21DD0573]MEA4276325.1 M13 family metallopeptidase [Mycoplasma sp. 21DD0573]
MSKPRLEDNFYEYVNYEWLNTATIPSDRSSMSAFGELDIKLEKLLKDLTVQWANGQKELPNDPMMKQYVEFYKMIIDKDKRKEIGIKPAKDFLKNIEELKSFEQLASNFDYFNNRYVSLPLSFGVGEDFKNNKLQVLWLDEFSLILPSKETYENEQEANRLMTVWINMVFDLLQKYGFDERKSNDLINKAIAFDLKIKDYVLSDVQKADYVSLYNPREILWYADKSSIFNIPNIAEQLVGQKVEMMPCSNVKFIENLNNIFNSETFEEYKALFFIKNLIFAASYLDEETRIKATEFKNAIYSIQKPRDLEMFAYDLATKYFKEPLGMYYAKHFFGEKAKKDVEHMVANMIEVYKKNLEENTWLSKETIKKAITKLNKLGVMVGYPEIIRPFYKDFVVKTYEQGSNILENVLFFESIKTQYNLSQYNQLKNDKYWSMSPAEINAYFNPFANHIVFPAAILQAPYYDINQSSSANYGGIGAVIAHEISHAFDNNGSQFDENGSLNNWWTDEDRVKFDEKIAAVIKLYDGKETKYGKVNGKLTVSENIADIGGVSCAFEAAKLENDFNPKNFFENWARVWRMIITEGSAKRRLESDVHSPSEIRGNVVLLNNPDFTKTYNLNENDQMFLPEEEQIKIW